MYDLRYLKDIGRWWFILHQALNYLVVILTVLSVIIIVWHKGTFVASLHHIIGVFILFLSFIQPILGVLADKLWSPVRTKVPTFPDKAHWWIGRVAILAGIFNNFFGLCEYQAHKAVWIVFGVWVGIYDIAHIYAELQSRGKLSHGTGSITKVSPVSTPADSMETFSTYSEFGDTQLVEANKTLDSPIQQQEEQQETPGSGCWQQNKQLLILWLTLAVVGVAVIVASTAMLFHLPTSTRSCPLP